MPLDTVGIPIYNVLSKEKDHAHSWQACVVLRNNPHRRVSALCVSLSIIISQNRLAEKGEFMANRPLTDRQRPTGITLPETLIRRLDTYAMERSLSRSAAIKLAVSELLMRQEREIRTQQSAN